MSRAPLIDTHAHLTDTRFVGDIDSVLERAQQAGLVSALIVGTSAATSRSVLELCSLHAWLYPAVGLHPCHLLDEPIELAWPAIEQMARLPEVRALGETGLDNYWKEVPLQLQKESLIRHLDLARELGKPVVLHCREAADDLLPLLEDRALRLGPVRGVLHSFAGTAEEARRGLAAGLHLSFSGMITYPKNESLRAVAATVPADRLLIETDAPYLSPQAWRSKRNEPAYVAATCEALARCRGQSLAEVAQQTTANARALFRMDPQTDRDLPK
jgi:TatD DNase family protein